MNEQTMSKLIEMKMNGMPEAYEEQSSNREFQHLDFDERTPGTTRRLRAFQTKERQAAPADSSRLVHQFECLHRGHRVPCRPSVEKEQILKLASGTYILDGHNLNLKGPTGSGKTYLATAFGVSACRQSFKVRYIRLPELLDELTLAKLATDGSYRRLLKKYTKVDLLTLDE